MQCGCFFIILHLLGLQMGLPVGTFCVRVALMRIELRLNMEVTVALGCFKGCCGRVFDTVPIIFALSCQYGVEDCVGHRGVSFVCAERNLKKRELHFHF